MSYVFVLFLVQKVIGSFFKYQSRGGCRVRRTSTFVEIDPLFLKSTCLLEWLSLCLLALYLPRCLVRSPLFPTERQYTLLLHFRDCSCSRKKGKIIHTVKLLSHSFNRNRSLIRISLIFFSKASLLVQRCTALRLLTGLFFLLSL